MACLGTAVSYTIYPSLSHYIGGWPGLGVLNKKDKRKMPTLVYGSPQVHSQCKFGQPISNNFKYSTVTKWQAVDHFTWYISPCHDSVSFRDLNIRIGLKMHLMCHSTLHLVIKQNSWSGKTYYPTNSIRTLQSNK
jgi:hypothetical protein